MMAGTMNRGLQLAPIDLSRGTPRPANRSEIGYV